MTVAEICLGIAILITWIWNFIWTSDVSHVADKAYNKSSYATSQIKNMTHTTEDIHDDLQRAKGDTRLLAEKLGVRFDTIPKKEERRVIIRNKDEQIVEKPDDFIDLQEEIDFDTD